jgi:Chaperone of endosialidase
MAMWLTTGTISVTNGSTTVIGVGTTFSQANVGSELMLRTGAPPDGGPVTGPPYEVTAIASDLALTIFPAYGGTTASGQAYALRPITFSMEKDLIERIDTLLTKIDGLMFVAGNDKIINLDKPVISGNAIHRYRTTGVDKWRHGAAADDNWRLQRWTGSVWEDALVVPISGPVSILADNSVTETKIANGAVTSAKILDGTIASGDLSSGVNTSINNKVLKAGDLMTGDLAITKDFAAILLNTNNQVNAPRVSWRVGSTERWIATLTVAEGGANTGSQLSFQSFSDAGSFLLEGLRLNRANGNLFIVGNGFKPGGGDWADSSDVRIKDNIADYTSGLAEILELRPRTFNYKAETKRDTTKIHVGLIAQECEKVMPELVRQEATPIGDIHLNDMRILDATALIYALVNAVKELAQRVEDLETEI